MLQLAFASPADFFLKQKIPTPFLTFSLIGVFFRFCSMRGWFDAFRTGGGPTLYESERTAATHDNILLGLYATFAALFLAFLVIIPGIRNNVRVEEKSPFLIFPFFLVAHATICLID
jgi:Dual oxidase maturation factor